MNLKIKINKLINKLLNFNLSRTYTVIETNEGVKLVKVLNIYSNSNDAQDDMFDLALNQKNEIEVLQNYIQR